MMCSFLEMIRALLALDKAHLEAIDNALHGKEETLTPWSHKEEVRQIQAYNRLNKDEFGDIIYD